LQRLGEPLKDEICQRRCEARISIAQKVPGPGREGNGPTIRSEHSCIVSLKYSSMKDRAAVAAGGHF
jgi:hypothetical protein